MSAPFLSVLIPTFNGSSLLRQAVESVLAQGFGDFEIIVSDDCSTDDTGAVAGSLGDPRIRYRRNAENLGYGRNLAAGAAEARGQVLFLLGHDDIVLPDALARTCWWFQVDPSVVIVTRPYYWFTQDPRRPVRAVRPFDPASDAPLTLHGGREQVQALFRSAGQLSGLAYRRSAMDVGFHHDIFPAHVYPFADTLKRGKAVYLKDYTIAVRIESSMTRHRPDTYSKSPTLVWMEMFDAVYGEPAYADARRYGKELLLARNFEGLVQLRNYAGTGPLIRELGILLRLRPRNLLAPKFWAYGLLCLLTPAALLVRLTDAYKRQVLGRALRDEVSVARTGPE